jgi:hypothetical protein
MHIIVIKPMSFSVWKPNERACAHRRTSLVRFRPRLAKNHQDVEEPARGQLDLAFGEPDPAISAVHSQRTQPESLSGPAS